MTRRVTMQMGKKMARFVDILMVDKAEVAKRLDGRYKRS